LPASRHRVRRKLIDQVFGTPCEDGTVGFKKPITEDEVYAELTRGGSSQKFGIKRNQRREILRHVSDTCKTRCRNMARQHYPLTNIVDDHLYPRDEAIPFLGGVSVPTLRRMEREGILKPIRLNKRSPTAQVYYSGKNIREVQGE
jgi:hypothetical protein